MNHTKAQNAVDYGPIGMLIFWAATTMCWWALAFWPPTDSASWLSRTQFVCFGKLPGQLLPLNGWILLFGGPVLLLLALLIVYNTEIIDSLKYLFQKKRALFVAWLLLMLFMVELVWVGYRIFEDYKLTKVSFAPQENGKLPAEYPLGQKPLPEFSLVDQFGKKITQKTFQGKTVVMSFVFAHCAAVCPTLVRQVTSAMAKLDPQKTEGLLVTLDPWRDRPSSLQGMAEEWELPSNTHMLSGKISDVVKLHKDFELPLQRDEKTGDVAHPSLVYIISPQGKIAYTFNNPSVTWLVEAVGRVQGR